MQHLVTNRVQWYIRLTAGEMPCAEEVPGHLIKHARGVVYAEL